MPGPGLQLGHPGNVKLFESPQSRGFTGIKLFGFHGEVGFEPVFPAALQGVDLGESKGNHFLCHPGTGSLVGSGAVKNDGFVFAVFSRP